MKALDQLKNDSWVTPFLGHYKKALAASLALGVLTLLFATALMFVSGYLISAAASQPQRGLFELLIPIGFVQLFGIGKPFLGYLERLESHDWVLHVTSKLRKRLYRVIEKDGMFWTAAHKAGDALGLLSEDIGHVQNLYLRSVFPLLIAWTLGAVVVVALGLFSWPCAIMLLIGFVAMAFLMPMLSLLANAARQARAKKLRRNLYGLCYDNIAGLSDWKFSQRTNDYSESWLQPAALLDEAEAALNRSIRRQHLALKVIFGLVAFLLLIIAGMQFGSMEAGANSIEQGASATANWIAAVVLGFFPLLEAFQGLPDAAVEGASHFDAIENLNKLEDGEPRALKNDEKAIEEGGCGKANASIPAGFCIDVRNMTFYHKDSLKPALEDLSLTIPEGQKLAILGPSGSGKSTLLSLIRGDLTPTWGTIKLGGIDAKALNECGLTPQIIGYMQQNSYLFNQSIMGNLKVGNPAVTQKQAEEVMEAVGLGHLLQSLPHGLKTVVEEAGLSLSGGERHRLAFARLLLQDSPILLLDEPMASLDPQTESSLLATVFAAFEKQTIVFVTHHLQGIELFDRVIFLDEGMITLDGTPKELIASSERFNRLLAFDRGWSI